MRTGSQVRFQHEDNAFIAAVRSRLPRGAERPGSGAPGLFISERGANFVQTELNFGSNWGAFIRGFGALLQGD